MRPNLAYMSFCLMVLAVWSAPSGYAQQGIIKGRVKAEGGKALEGVRVQAVNVADKQEKHQTQTDDKGEFELNGLRTGAYVLTFEQPGFRTFVTRAVEVTDGETLKIRRPIELAREREPYALVRGAVFTSEGFSLPNATVIIERLDSNKRFKSEKISGEGGIFAFRLPPDPATYRITARARGFQSSSIELTVDSGDEVRQVALSLEREK